MVFKRRDPRSWTRIAADFFYPRRGWRRATSYVLHRLRRLPDSPHSIARGVAAGMFCNFPPLFGVQMLSAALLAWVFRGNVLAAVLATFVSNPVTTPLIALMSLELGHWMLGTQAGLDMGMVVEAFTAAGTEIWSNLIALFTHEPTRWYRLKGFFLAILLPYTLGSIVPGIVASVATYYLSLPLITAYHRLRDRRRIERAEQRRAGRMLDIARAEAADWQDIAADAPPPPAPAPDGGKND